MLQDSRTGKDFLDKAPKTQEIKAKLDKCNYIKLKGCTAKEATKSVETAKLGGAVSTSCAPGSPKNLKPHYRKGEKVNKWAAPINRYFSKEDTEMTHRYLEKCLTPSIIRKFKSKLQ